MSTVPKVPPEVLLSRIARLERLVSSLEKQLADQKAVAEDIGRALQIQSKRITGNADFARGRLRKIEEQLLVVVEKLFPGHARTQLQIRDIFKGKSDS